MEYIKTKEFKFFAAVNAVFPIIVVWIFADYDFAINPGFYCLRYNFSNFGRKYFCPGQIPKFSQIIRDNHHTESVDDFVDGRHELYLGHSPLGVFL